MNTYKLIQQVKLDSGTSTKCIDKEKILFLSLIFEFRFLTREQLKVITNSPKSLESISRRLRSLKSENFIDFQGGSGKGHLKSKQSYFLTKKGYDYLVELFEGESLIEYKSVTRSATKQREHRNAVMDVVSQFINAFSFTDLNQKFTIKKVFLDSIMDQNTRATTDEFRYKSNIVNITPDFVILISYRGQGNFILFGEVDRDTESILLENTNAVRSAIAVKFQMYDAYFYSSAFIKKYEEYGDIINPFPTMAFITTTSRRVDNIINKLDLKIKNRNKDYDDHFLFTTIENIKDFGAAAPIWRGRNPNDSNLKSLF